jgi:hypothetical protein
MKKLIFTLVFISALSHSYGQKSDNSFVITEDAQVTDIALYEKALNNADMDRYRYLDSRRVIKFQKGVVIELFSANEMIEKGMTVQIEKIRKAPIEKNTEPNFVLKPSGYIIEQHTAIGKRKIN